MIYLAIKFVLGLGILLFSTEKFVYLAKRISIKLGISPLIIGVTLVALGTSIPELVVSGISVAKQDTPLAIGNIIGSNTINILLIFPVGILIGKLRIGKIKTQQTALLFLASTGIFFISQNKTIPHIYTGIGLILLSMLFSFLEYKLGVFGRSHEDAKNTTKSYSGKINLAQFIIGFFLLTLIVIGGILIVDSVEAISLFTGISTSVLGLTLTAIATSLPELLTTIYSQKNHQEKITVGNILGSNVYNLLLIGGILTLSSAHIIITQKEWAWLLGTTVGFFLILKSFKGLQPPKWIGLLILLLFFIYIFTFTK